MTPLLVLLPMIALGLGSVVSGIAWPEIGAARQILRAAALWGVAVVASTEVLSLVHAINLAALAAFWAAVIVAEAWAVVRARAAGWRWGPIDLRVRRLGPEGWLLFGVVPIVLVTFLLAVWVPPQNVDSLIYHVSRVAHWAQQQSVSHFITGIDRQNVFSPGAEMAVLHFYVLGQGDRWVNLIQWGAMLGSLVGVWALAALLGGGWPGKILSVVAVATIPMGIVESSNTMNDYVASFLVVVAAAESLAVYSGRSRSVVIPSLAAGLAVLVKPTALPFVLVSAGLVAVAILRSNGVASLLRAGLAAAAIVTIMNAGYLWRNVRTYGGLLGPAQISRQHINQTLAPASIVSNVLRTAALHAGTPWPSVNEWIYTQIVKVHVKLGVSLRDPKTTCCGYFRPPVLTTYEDVVGNPLHALLMAVTFGAGFLRLRRLGRPASLYLGMVTGGFILFVLIFKWQSFASRLHLPFFVLAGPGLGLIWERMVPRSVRLAVAVALLAGSIPWLVGVHSRPLVPNRESYVDSIFKETRERLLFANHQVMYEAVVPMTDRILASSCASVGLMLGGDSLEYPIWALLGAPRDRLWLEWIVAGTPTERYASTGFRPCAVVCQHCPEDWTRLRGLDRAMDRNGFALFLCPEAIAGGSCRTESP